MCSQISNPYYLYYLHSLQSLTTLFVKLSLLWSLDHLTIFVLILSLFIPLLLSLFFFFTSHLLHVSITPDFNFFFFHTLHPRIWGFSGGTAVKYPLANTEDAGDPGSIPGLGRSPGDGNGNSCQHSCLGTPIDRGAWQATVHGVSKSWTWLRD